MQDNAAKQQARNELASLIIDNLDEIVTEAVASYAELYPYSSTINLPMDVNRQWAAYDIESMARCIRSGISDTRGHANYGGDIVLQRNPLFAPIANYVEGHLFLANVIAGFVWRSQMADHDRRTKLLDCLEESIQYDIAENMQSFIEEFTLPRTLVRTWKLDARQSFSKVETTPERYTAIDSNTEPPSPNLASEEIKTGNDSPLDYLTQREREIFDLIITGRQNAEIAAELHLQRSTVKNAISRIFYKFEVNSRTELVIAAHRLGID